MKTRNALIVSLAFNCAFIGAFTYRWIEQSRTPRHREIRHQIILKNKDADSLEVFELNHDQLKGIQRKRHHFYPTVDSLRIDLRKHREKLGNLLSESILDTTIIMKQVDSIGALQTQMEKEVVIQLLDEKSVLNPEQQTYFVDVMLEHLQCDTLQCPHTQIKIIKKELHSQDKKNVIQTEIHTKEAP